MATLFAGLLSAQPPPKVAGADVTATMTAGGTTFNPGDLVTYTVVLTNSGNAAQPDNPGNEFVDVLPASVTLVSVTASAGTIGVRPAGLNPASTIAASGTEVVWNGAIAVGQSRTILIKVTPRSPTCEQFQISLDGTVSNQGTVSFDADGNGTNETSRVTDDPGTPGPDNPTVFTVPTTLGTPIKISYTGPAVPIPDGSGASPGAPAVASLPVSGVAGRIYDVDVRIDGTDCSSTAGSTTVGLDHTFVSDLQLTLRSPAGTEVLVVSNTDGSGNNFCQTVLDDESAADIQTVVTTDAPFTGSFTPNAPLSAFDGEDPNGTWELQAQDFVSADTGNIRAFSVIITPELCEIQLANVTATKTASGAFTPGGTITYTVVLTNSGAGAQSDNAGDEFTDTIPAQLTLVSASASSGTATSAGNTVSWNGSIAASGSVTITIIATVNAGTAGQTVSNQGTFSYDSNADLTNDATGLTDDPATATPGDPTSVTVTGVSPVEIPAVSEIGLALLCLVLSGAALLLLRRRRPDWPVR